MLRCLLGVFNKLNQISQDGDAGGTGGQWKSSPLEKIILPQFPCQEHYDAEHASLWHVGKDSFVDQHFVE
jgi:hypothetical protein